MTTDAPLTELGAFSSPGAVATSWDDARAGLEAAQLYWLTTVRPDGRPHVTPLIGIWHEGAFVFCTGADERKAKNLGDNPFCVVTTGSNSLDGVDLVVEGSAAQATDEAALGRIADGFEAKYGQRFTEPTGTWFGLGDALRSGAVPAFLVAPAKAFAFGKGEQFSQTRYRFG